MSAEDLMSSGITLSSQAWPSGVVEFQLHDGDYPDITTTMLDPDRASTGVWVDQPACENTASFPLPSSTEFADQVQMCESIQHLLRAMAEWEARVPAIEFVPIAQTSTPSGDYLRIQVGKTAGGTGFCSYNIGKVSANVRGHIGRQTGANRLRVDPSDGTCDVNGFTHELGHTLGLWHTQGRADRDDWITRNAARDANAWFQNIKGPADFEDVGPFDFDSVMLYDSYTSNGTHTYLRTPSPGEITLTGAGPDVSIDVSDAFNGASYQSDFYGSGADRWRVEVDWLASYSGGGGPVTCFAAGGSTGLLSVDSSLHVQFPANTIPGGPYPTSVLTNDLCYSFSRRGPNGEPAFRRFGTTVAGEAYAAFPSQNREAEILTAGDISGVYWQYADLHDDGLPLSGNEFGDKMAAGDFDGDGIADLAIAAPGTTGTGSVFLFKGVFERSDDSGMVHHAPWRVIKPVQPEALAVGDFDGDGIDDLAVGIPTAGAGGEVWIYSRNGLHDVLGRKTTIQLDSGVDYAGRPGPSGSSWPPFSASDEFGYALAAYDFDNDGADELLVGAPGSVPLPSHFDPFVHSPAGPVTGPWDEVNDPTGVVYFFHGDATSVVTTVEGVLSPYSDFSTSSVKGSSSFSRFGAALAVVDVTGPADVLVVGAPDAPRLVAKSGGTIETLGNHQAPTTAAGNIFAFKEDLVSVPPPFPLEFSWRIDAGPGSVLSEFGHALSGNGNNLLVGAPGYNVESVGLSGAAYFYPGLEPTGPPTTQLELNGDDDVPATTSSSGGPCGAMAGDRFGAQVLLGNASEPSSDTWLVVSAPTRDRDCDTPSDEEGEGYLFDDTGAFAARLQGNDSFEHVGASLAILPRWTRSYSWYGTTTATGFSSGEPGQVELLVGNPGSVVPNAAGTSTTDAGSVMGLIDFATTPTTRTMFQR